jgi:hypothetical protein
MKLDFFWDRDPDLLVFAGKWPTPERGKQPRQKPFSVIFSHIRNLHDVATVAEMFPPPDGELWSLAAVPRAKLPTNTCRVTVHDDWEATADLARRELWFRELVLVDETAPVGASATHWSEQDGSLTITGIRAAATTVANNALDDAGVGVFRIPGIAVAIAPDPRENFIENRTFSVGPPAYRVCMRGNTLYPTAYPESAEARTRVVVRIDKAPGHMGLTLSSPDLASEPVAIEVLRLPRERLMDRNGTKNLLQECALVETLRVSAAESASWTLNAQAFAPLDRVVLRLSQTPKETKATAEATQAMGWRGFGRKPPEMTPLSNVASPPVLLEFFVDGVRNAGFGPCLALANYLLDLEPDLALSRVLRREQPEAGTATRAHAARRLCLPSQLAYLQHARHFGGNRAPADYLAHADRATLPVGAPDLTDRSPIMTDLIERHVQAAVGFLGEQKTEIRLSQRNLNDLVLSDQMPLDLTRALMMNGPVCRMLLALGVQPAMGNEARFHADLCSLLAEWTDEVRERDALAQIIRPDDRPAPGAAPEEWQTWFHTVSDEYLGNALFDWMTGNARTVPHLMELTPLLIALSRTWTRDKEGPLLHWLFKVGKRVLGDQNNVQDPGLIVTQGAETTWAALVAAMNAAHEERTRPENNAAGNQDDKAFESFKTHLLNGLGMGPAIGAYGADAWPGLDNALRGLLKSGALGLPEAYDVTVQALADRLRYAEAEEG